MAKQNGGAGSKRSLPTPPGHKPPRQVPLPARPSKHGERGDGTGK